MATASESQLQLDQGTYVVDALHSHAGFEVEHAGLSVFRGAFSPVDARLTSGADGLALEGGVRVNAISIDDENIRPHLLSPEFFDADRNPEITFRSTGIEGPAEDLAVTGDLSMAGVSLPVTATGHLRGPVEAPGGGAKVALHLEAAIDRTRFGMNWQMEMPGGLPALANEVRLIVDLELARD
jgi:polyisoprenoid-binding protein YceI